MDNFFYFLSGRHRSDYKHLNYLKRSLSKGSIDFPKLTTTTLMSESYCEGFYLYGYLGLNYQLIKSSQQSQNILFIFDNPAIKLHNLPVLRVHQKTLEYFQIPAKSNVYYQIKYKAARSYFEAAKNTQVQACSKKLIKNIALVFDKSYPFTSLIDSISYVPSNDFHELMNNVLSPHNIPSVVSRKNPYISSISRFGIPHFTSSKGTQLGFESYQPSHVFAFQSTAILKYLFDYRVNCYVSKYNPFYLDDFCSVRHTNDFVHLLSDRFASTHFFFDEIIEYSQCINN